jgi:hypothetical protein
VLEPLNQGACPVVPQGNLKTALPELRPFFSITDLAERWRCSRASVYNRIRGERVVDFAASGHKGHKLVPLEIVLKIEQAHLKVLR